MANTTKEKVLLIAPELSVIDEDLFTLILEDISEIVSENVFKTKQERAQRYLAAHVLSLALTPSQGGVSSSVTGPATRQEVGRVEVEYSDIADNIRDYNRYDTTKYGIIYNTIKNQCVVPITVI